MEDMRIYITLENPETKQSMNIRGDFGILRAFLAGVGMLEILDMPPFPNNASTLSPSPISQHVENTQTN